MYDIAINWHYINKKWPTSARHPQTFDFDQRWKDENTKKKDQGSELFRNFITLLSIMWPFSYFGQVMDWWAKYFQQSAQSNFIHKFLRQGKLQLTLGPGGNVAQNQSENIQKSWKS